MSFISPSAKIGKNVLIGENVWIFDKTKIGDNSIIENNIILGHPSYEELNEFHINNKIKKLDLFSLDKFIKKKTQVGDDSFIGSGSVIYSGATIGDLLYCEHNVVIGNDSRIGTYSYIMNNSNIGHQVKIGNNLRLRGFCANRSEIGNNVSMMGALVHKYTVPIEGLIEPAPRICDMATIGMYAIVIGNVTIGKCSYVGAGAVVTKDVDPYHVIVGNPARVIGMREELREKMSEKDIRSLFQKKSL